ncbi:MAG TPA: hypothetical protein VF572_04680 [Candidatus Saccharimonadales bacterium]|jgi:hypothetical protein
MSDFLNEEFEPLESDNDSERERSARFERIGGNMAKIVGGMVEYGGFLSRKAARELMTEVGIVGVLGEEMESAIETDMAYAVERGLKLNMRGTVDPSSIEDVTADALERLPDFLQPSFQPLTKQMVVRGIALHRDEICAQSPKIQAWNEEYELLASMNDPDLS